MFDEDVDAIERRADHLIENHERLLADLVALRKRHRLTQTDVAERMGVSQPTVAGFERYDANPTLSTIRRYALAVGARIDERVEDDCVPGHHTADTFEAIVSHAAPLRFRAPGRVVSLGRGRVAAVNV
jgi:transcriptional regulator with XRE-family HTH domain